jgi:hypothetical protein
MGDYGTRVEDGRVRESQAEVEGYKDLNWCLNAEIAEEEQMYRTG